MANKTGTIFERIEKKLDNLEDKAKRKAEKEVIKQRITEMVRGMNFWEKLELTIKIWA